MLIVAILATTRPALAFFAIVHNWRATRSTYPTTTRLFSDWNNNQDSNQWKSISDDEYNNAQPDWQKTLQAKQDGTFWTSFESSDTDTEKPTDKLRELDEAEVWLDQLAKLSAEEVEFNLREADRADKVRQMQEWGFDSKTIASTLDVATDLSREEVDDGMQIYRKESYWEDVDLSTVESHTKVEKDPETNEPLRTQMVYVDEHTCIGCTNCATIAQSTFLMNPEYGRARVFEQWGDDEETIQIAIETCPVDCIHYIPYDELVKLEIERRDQNINFKARLVSQAEGQSAPSHRGWGGGFAYTEPQKISGNMKPRCNNCPSKGCYDCPMYGVGKNPEYERKEQERKARVAMRRLQQEREAAKKSAEL